MDSVYVVNDYLQSGDIGIFQILQGISSFVIAFFAIMMWWNARAQLKVAEKMKRNAEAHLKNATAMRELEETNVKIEVWPYIKKMIDETLQFVDKVAVSNVEGDFDCINQYIIKMRFMRYFISEDDELYEELISLIRDGNDMKLHFLEREKTSNSIRENELNTILIKERGKILKTINTIGKMFEVRFSVKIPPENLEKNSLI